MIVYNVNRRWFTEKAEAEAYRKVHGLKPAATVKIAVADRNDLAALLNALCEPTSPTVVKDTYLSPVLDRAYVEPQREVPDFVPLFLIADVDKRKAIAADRADRGLTGEE